MIWGLEPYSCTYRSHAYIRSIAVPNPIYIHIILWSVIRMTSLWACRRLKSPASRLSTQPFTQGADQRKHQSSVTGLCAGNSPVENAHAPTADTRFFSAPKLDRISLGFYGITISLMDCINVICHGTRSRRWFYDSMFIFYIVNCFICSWVSRRKGSNAILRH